MQSCKEQQQEGFIRDKEIIQIDYKCRFNLVPRSINLNPFTKKNMINKHNNNNNNGVNKHNAAKQPAVINIKQHPFINNSIREQVIQHIIKKQSSSIIYNNYSPNQISISQSDSNILFDSQFPMSNLQLVSRVKNGHYNVYMRPDTNTEGNFQWFYFRVYVKKKRMVKFTIKNFIKSTMLYSQGLRPFYVSKIEAKREKETQKQKQKQKESKINCNISSSNNNNNNNNNNNSSSSCFATKYKQISQQVHFSQDSQTQYFNLTFSFQFLYDNDEVQFCSQPPYGIYELQNTIDKLKNCKRYVIGKTILGRKIPYLVVNENNVGKEKEKDKQKDKQKERSIFERNNIEKYNNNNQKAYDKFYDKIKQKNILEQNKIIAIAIARQHPGQAVGSWMMDGFMTQINKLKFSPLIKWIIIPMVNIDGVQLGNNRTGALGHDFNRNWNIQQGSKKQKMFPQISCILNYIRKLKRKYPKRIKMFLDLHGHSSQQNVFTYGPPHSEKTQGYYMSRMFPQILSKKNQNFKLSQSSYHIHNEKKNTARSISISELKIPFTYTIQCTFGVMNFSRITSSQIIKIGEDIALSANQFLESLFLNKDQTIQSNLLLNSIKQKYKNVKVDDEVDQYETASDDSQKYENNKKRKQFENKLEDLLESGQDNISENRVNGVSMNVQSGNNLSMERNNELIDNNINSNKNCNKNCNKNSKIKNNLKILRSQTLQTKSKYHKNQQYNQDFSHRPYRKNSQSNSLIKSVFIYDQTSSISLNSSVDYPNPSTSPRSKHKKSLRVSTQPNIFDQCAYFPPIKNNRSQQIYQKGVLNRFPSTDFEHKGEENGGQISISSSNNVNSTQNKPVMNMKEIQQRLFKLRHSKIGKRILVINAYGV